MSTKRILVVDDQPHVLRVIKLGLERKGYAVDSAGNGEEALGRLRRQRYDVLVTDMEMPRMNGRGLCDAVQAEYAEDLPLTVIVTGCTDVDIREWARGLSKTKFLEKPLSLRALSALLDGHLAAGAAS